MADPSYRPEAKVAKTSSPLWRSAIYIGSKKISSRMQISISPAI